MPLLYLALRLARRKIEAYEFFGKGSGTMAFYLVSAKPKRGRLDRLEQLLRERAFVNLTPFGRTLHKSLSDARLGEDGLARWEEEDYCSPPLAQERDAVLDKYFDDIDVESVQPDEGWSRINDLEPLFPDLCSE